MQDVTNYNGLQRLAQAHVVGNQAPPSSSNSKLHPFHLERQQSSPEAVWQPQRHFSCRLLGSRRLGNGRALAALQLHHGLQK